MEECLQFETSESAPYIVFASGPVVARGVISAVAEFMVSLEDTSHLACCFGANYADNGKRQWTPERRAIGQTHGRGFNPSNGVNPNSILECTIMLQNQRRTPHVSDVTVA
jgi:hypothetical protein